jgi:diguanylate cyclase (GGDEF)-like protein/PAS domain S-box-containing protein
MTILGMLAWFAAAVSLWLGARRYDHAIGRAYQWLAGGAALYCSGLVVLETLGGTLNPAPGLSFTNLPALLALAATAVGTAILATADRDGGTAGRRPESPDGAAGAENAAGARDSILPGLADGYVMAVALLVIGWTTVFSSEFHKSGDRPGTFLLGLVHPLADLAVLGALLPMVTAAWRRVMLPYLAVGVIAVGDALAVGQRVLGGHPGVAAQLLPVLAALLLGVAPWRITEGFGSNWNRRAASSAASTIVAALTASAATLVVIANGLAGAPASGVALVVAGGAGVLVLAGRVFMLVRENLAVLGIWRESSRSLRDLASRTSDVVLVCDLDGSVRYASPAVADYGYAPGALTGRRLLDYVHPEDRSAVLASVRLVLGGYQPADSGEYQRADSGETPEGTGGSGRFRVRVRAADGTWRHIESTLLRYQAPGEPIQMLVTARDVSDQVALRQQVTHLTFHDGLTGLPNRAYVEERARDVLRDATPGQAAEAGRTGVIFLDLDRFTAVNDSVGHGAGDLVLAQTARRLRAVVPVHDTVARWGSDEFAVLVENAASDQEVAEIADRLAGAVAGEPFRVAGKQIALTASVGVALADLGPGDPPGLVLRNADVAMSRAKDSGGDRVEVYAAHMHADVVRRLEIVSDLQRAISEGELTLQFQPIVDLASSRVTGAEALVRWWHDGQVISPREFLGAAEESGLIVPLGEWVLREACAQGASWRSSAAGASRDIGISVNLSARQITAPAFGARLAAILAETGLPPAALTVEINERILVEEDELITERLAGLHQLGVKLALDDFGTGYAALAHLRQLPLDIIKIDPSFVAGLGHDETLTRLTRTVVQVGRDLGLQVIAEGIEQPRQLIALREMGCESGQGFLLARPMGVPGVDALLKQAEPRSSDGSPNDGRDGGRDDQEERPSVSECETSRVSG